MPPPAPTKPQMRPTREPQTTDCTARLPLETPAIACLVVITGLTRNLMPSSSVMTVEKLPIVLLGTRLDAQLPTIVITSTAAIIIRPLRTSMFLFL